jgi:hypothetical protein
MTRKLTQALAHVLTKQNLTVFVKSGQRTVPRTHAQFNDLMAAVMAGNEGLVDSILNPQTLHKHSSGLWDVDGFGDMFIDGRKLPKALGDRLADFHANKWPLAPLVKLWKNILANPDKTAQTDLYPYLEYNGHPITSDGCFIAYRAVRKEEDGRLVDSHTGTMDNSVGSVVKLDRSKCDGDRNNTCSRGLHAANLDYVTKNYSGHVVVNVKINPKDVVAIPVDYDNHKMRCCEFKIVSLNEELTELKGLQNLDNEDTGEDYGDGEYSDDYDTEEISSELGAIVVQAGLSKEDLGPETWKLQKRDANGRFIRGMKRKS